MHHFRYKWRVVIFNSFVQTLQSARTTYIQTFFFLIWNISSFCARTTRHLRSRYGGGEEEKKNSRFRILSGISRTERRVGVRVLDIWVFLRGGWESCSLLWLRQNCHHLAAQRRPQICVAIRSREGDFWPPFIASLWGRELRGLGRC